jgi:hypothetical protein
MVPQRELDDAFGGRRLCQKSRSEAAVVEASCEGAAQFEPRLAIRQETHESGTASQHEGGPIQASLKAFADVVEERRSDEVRFIVTPGDEPVGGSPPVDDVAWVLLFEQFDQGKWQVSSREVELLGPRKPGGAEELVKTPAHQMMTLRTWLATPVMNQPIGL